MNMETLELVMWVIGSLGAYKASESGAKKVIEIRKNGNGKLPAEFTKVAHDEICSLKLENLKTHIDNRFDKIEGKL